MAGIVKHRGLVDFPDKVVIVPSAVPGAQGGATENDFPEIGMKKRCNMSYADDNNSRPGFPDDDALSRRVFAED